MQEMGRMKTGDPQTSQHMTIDREMLKDWLKIPRVSMIIAPIVFSHWAVGMKISTVIELTLLRYSPLQIPMGVTDQNVIFKQISRSRWED